jgi:predicted MFS family arabinose efflux permease
MSQTDDQEEIVVEPEEKPVSYLKMLTNRRLLLAALSCILRDFVFTYNANIMIPYLTEDFGISKKQAGMMFSVILCTLIPTNIAIQIFKLPRRMPRRAFLITSTLIEGLASIFVGPSLAFGIPNEIGFMIAGQLILGICFPFLLAFSLPEMQEAVSKMFP